MLKTEQESIVARSRRAYQPRKGPALDSGTILQIAPDGYVRKIPVQGIRVPVDYRARKIRRAVSMLLSLAFAAVVIYVFFRFIVF